MLLRGVLTSKEGRVLNGNEGAALNANEEGAGGAQCHQGGCCNQGRAY